MKQVVKNAIFKVADKNDNGKVKVFEAYEIDYAEGKVWGYDLFAGLGNGNPCRVFKLSEVDFAHLRKY